MTYDEILNLIFSSITTLFGCFTAYMVIFAAIGLFTYKRFPATDDKKTYGVIIPARNEEKVVGNLIESIKHSNYPQDKLHIFVIAHNCTDNTAEVARACAARFSEEGIPCKISVYEYENPDECTMGYAFRHLFGCIDRDYGIGSYDGFFLFNSDNILDENFFTKMNDAFVACGGDKVITSYRNTKNFGTNAMTGAYGLLFMRGCLFEGRGRTVCGCSTRVQGTGYVVPSKYLAGGWKYVTLTEDWEFTADVIMKGVKVVYCDEAVFYDEQPTTFRVMWRQRVRWAKGHLLVCTTKWKDLFRYVFTRRKKGEKKRIRGSAYDIMAEITPFQIVATFLTILQILLTLLSPLFMADWASAWTSMLVSWALNAVTLVIGYALSAAFLVIVWHKRIKNCSFLNRVITVLFYPIFGLLNVPISLVAFFSKNVAWKQIPHTDQTSHAQLNASAKKSKKEKRD